MGNEKRVQNGWQQGGLHGVESCHDRVQDLVGSGSRGIR